MKIGEKIKKYRNIKNITQSELSDKSGISRSHIASIETGKYNPSLETLKKLAHALSISLESLTSENQGSDEGLYILVDKLIKATANKKLSWENKKETDLKDDETAMITYFGEKLFSCHKKFNSKPKGFYTDPKFFWMQELSLEVEEIVKLGIQHGAYLEEIYICYDIVNMSVYALFLVEDSITNAKILYLGYKKRNEMHILGADIIELQNEKKPELVSNKIATNLRDLRLIAQASSPGGSDLIESLIESLDFEN